MTVTGKRWWSQFPKILKRWSPLRWATDHWGGWRWGARVASGLLVWTPGWLAVPVWRQEALKASKVHGASSWIQFWTWLELPLTFKLSCWIAILIQNKSQGCTHFIDIYSGNLTCCKEVWFRSKGLLECIFPETLSVTGSSHMKFSELQLPLL